MNKKKPNDRLKKKEKKLPRLRDFSKKKDNVPKKKPESKSSKPKPKKNVKRLKLLQPQLRNSDWSKKLLSSRDKD